MSMTHNFLGNRYKSVNVTVPGNTTDFSVMEEYPSHFPDWNANWDERDYWTICIIKDIESSVSDPEIKIKFHSERYDLIPLSRIDMPAIFEPFVFRDLYITNEFSYDISISVSVFNNRTITPPPYKPKNLAVKDYSTSYITIQFDDTSLKNDSFDEKYFRIERSTTSSTEGFTQIDTIKESSLRFQNQYEKLDYTDESVSSGNTYWYRVRAYNEDGGNSPYSNVVEVSI